VRRERKSPDERVFCTVQRKINKKKMSDIFSAKQVKRFDGTNYQGWKFQITAVLMANEIFEVVDGSRVMPATVTNDNAAIAKAWTRDNAKAMAIISSAMEHSIGKRSRLHISETDVGQTESHT